MDFNSSVTSGAQLGLNYQGFSSSRGGGVNTIKLEAIDSHANAPKFGGYTCKRCNIDFGSQEGLKRHYNSTDPDISKFKVECETCKEVFRSESFLQSHRDVAHQNTSQDDRGDCFKKKGMFRKKTSVAYNPLNTVKSETCSDPERDPLKDPGSMAEITTERRALKDRLVVKFNFSKNKDAELNFSLKYNVKVELEAGSEGSHHSEQGHTPSYIVSGRFPTELPESYRNQVLDVRQTGVKQSSGSFEPTLTWSTAVRPLCSFIPLSYRTDRKENHCLKRVNAENTLSVQSIDQGLTSGSLASNSIDDGLPLDLSVAGQIPPEYKKQTGSSEFPEPDTVNGNEMGEGDSHLVKLEDAVPLTRAVQSSDDSVLEAIPVHDVAQNGLAIECNDHSEEINVDQYQEDVHSIDQYSDTVSCLSRQEATLKPLQIDERSTLEAEGIGAESEEQGSSNSTIPENINESEIRPVNSSLPIPEEIRPVSEVFQPDGESVHETISAQDVVAMECNDSLGANSVNKDQETRLIPDLFVQTSSTVTGRTEQSAVLHKHDRLGIPAKLRSGGDVLVGKKIYVGSLVRTGTRKRKPHKIIHFRKVSDLDDTKKQQRSLHVAGNISRSQESKANVVVEPELDTMAEQNTPCSESLFEKQQGQSNRIERASAKADTEETLNPPVSESVAGENISQGADKLPYFGNKQSYLAELSQEGLYVEGFVRYSKRSYEHVVSDGAELCRKKVPKVVLTRLSKDEIAKYTVPDAKTGVPCPGLTDDEVSHCLSAYVKLEKMPSLQVAKK